MHTKSVFTLAALLGLLLTNKVQSQITPANNYISVDVSTFPQNAGFNYDSCFALGANIGISSVGLFQNWTAIETAPNTYNLSLFDIANVYYPFYNMPIDLTITPIHTNNLEVPSDLVNTAFDNPILINRFKTLLDSVKVHIPDVTLSSLVIGSEHDIYMGTNAGLWAAYSNFYDAVAAYAKTLWPGVKVATELTFGGITSQSTLAQNLNSNSDYIGVSYYPLNNNFTVKPLSTIPADFATIVGLYPSTPINFYQYGYPSSTICNSSEALQAQFITQTFSTWDSYPSNIRMIDFTWLHDLDTAAVNFYGTYYGISDSIFLAYLQSLGLRTWNGNGTHKAAFTELQCQSKQRGYHNLNISCTTQIADQIPSNNLIAIYPNPAQNEMYINLSHVLINAQIKLYNSLGQVALSQPNCNGNSLSINTTHLANGIYSIMIQNNHTQLIEKLVINK
jgi:hypothetical protein